MRWLGLLLLVAAAMSFGCSRRTAATGDGSAAEAVAATADALSLNNAVCRGRAACRIESTVTLAGDAGAEPLTVASVVLDYPHVADRGVACLQPLLAGGLASPDRCEPMACPEREIWRVDPSGKAPPVRLETHCASAGEAAPKLERLESNVLRETFASRADTFVVELRVSPPAILYAQRQSDILWSWNFTQAVGKRCPGQDAPGGSAPPCEPALGPVSVRSPDFAAAGWMTTDYAKCGFSVPVAVAGRPPSAPPTVTVVLTTDDRLYAQIDDEALASGRVLAALSIEGDFVDAKPLASPLRTTVWSDGTVCDRTECRAGGAAVAGSGRLRRMALDGATWRLANLWLSYDRGPRARPSNVPASDRRVPVLVGPPLQTCAIEDGALLPEAAPSEPPPG